jgi:hypothetical protein
VQWNYIKDVLGFEGWERGQHCLSAARGNFMFWQRPLLCIDIVRKDFLFYRSSFFLQLERFPVSEIA